MSETVSAPASAPAPAAAPAAPPSPDHISGPPNQQPALSVSEAARLLNRQRREASDTPQARQAPPARTPSPNEVRQQQARLNPTPPQQAEARLNPPPPSSAAEAMARALGVPTEAMGANSGPPEAPIADAIEFDGVRYAPDQLRALIREGGDYTKKTQALGEQGRTLQAQQSQLQAQADALAQVLPLIQPEIERLTRMIQDVPLPDEQLINTNPQEYLLQRHRWEAAQREQNRLAQIGNLQGEAHARAVARQLETANAELAKEYPAWGDPKQRAAWQQEIVDWALDRGGYTRDELRGLTDHRHLKTMMKALQFDKWVSGAKTAAPAAQLRAPVRGYTPPPAPSERVVEAESAFDTRPNVRNAAALLTARRSNGAA